jgi:hypothetical protein
MPLRFQQAVPTMDIWSANSPNGAGLRGRHGFLASWRPLYSGTGAVKVTGSPFGTFVEAEAACNMMLVVLNEAPSAKAAGRSGDTTPGTTSRQPIQLALGGPCS